MPVVSRQQHEVQPGDTLCELAMRYRTTVESLQRLNPLVDLRRLRPGQILRLPAKQPQTRRSPGRRQPAIRTDASAARAAPAPAPAPVVWCWPVTWGTLTSDCAPRWGRMQNGIEIAVAAGTRAVAARAGKVSFAGWEDGCGYCVAIDHGDGFQTRYAHASALLAASGDTVAQGSPVITVTGPQLHFEVIRDGSPQDPRKFLP